MAYNKITEAALVGKGVIGMSDTPELSCEEMQEKMEETVRSVVIPAFNSLVDRLTERDADTYTKSQTENLVNQKVVEIGSSDMMKAVYDDDNDGVVNSAENGIFLYEMLSDGEGWMLSGVQGKIGRFKAVNDTATFSAIKVNTAQYRVVCGTDDEIELIKGNWYTFILDGETINFNSGGADMKKATVYTGSDFPVSPKKHDIFFENNTSALYWYDGVNWVKKDMLAQEIVICEGGVLTREYTATDSFNRGDGNVEGKMTVTEGEGYTEFRATDAGCALLWEGDLTNYNRVYIKYDEGYGTSGWTTTGIGVTRKYTHQSMYEDDVSSKRSSGTWTTHSGLEITWDITDITGWRQLGLGIRHNSGNRSYFRLKELKIYREDE